MPHCTRWMVPLACAGLLAGMAATAQARGGVSVGVSVGVRGGGGGYHGHGGGYRHGGGYGYGGYGWRSYGGWGPAWVFVGPPLLYPLVTQPVEVVPQTVVVTQPAPVAVAPSQPDPVIYPRTGQNAQQTEFDRQDCNRWATTLPAALADAAVFHRAVEACMDGRGYTLK